MRACATCLKRKLSEVMVPAKGNKKSENNFAGLVATTVPEKDTIWKTDPVKDSSLKRSNKESKSLPYIPIT